MNKAGLITAAGIIAIISAVVGYAAPPPDHFTIDDCANKKSAVEFPHAKHFGAGEGNLNLPCSTCHHKQEDLSLETADQAKPCSECHLKPEEASTPICSQMSPKKNPYHLTCMGCHKKEAKGPTKCDDCHPKQ